MPNAAEFRFYEELNDFLPASKRKRSFSYSFFGAPVLKDVIEAQGVPHSLVDLILVNGVPAGFDDRLEDGARVSVYPVFESLDISPINRLRKKPLREIRFILGPQLAELRNSLCALGFDVSYCSTAEPSEIITRALEEGRILLTPHPQVLREKGVTRGYRVRSCHVRDQIREVVERFDLCGGPLFDGTLQLQVAGTEQPSFKVRG